MTADEARDPAVCNQEVFKPRMKLGFAESAKTGLQGTHVSFVLLSVMFAYITTCRIPPDDTFV